MNIIPNHLKYAKKVNTLNNNSYQEWLRKTIEQEDLAAWGKSEPEPQITHPWYSFLLP